MNRDSERLSCLDAALRNLGIELARCREIQVDDRSMPRQADVLLRSGEVLNCLRRTISFVLFAMA